MKRITKKAVTYGHTVYRYVGAHQQHPEGDAPGMISISGIMDLLSRLARYEDTGLEPEEIAALREQEERRWIPVEERLPDLIPCNAGTAYSEAVNVLTSGRKVLTAIWDGDDFIADTEFWEAEGEVVTHWTPVLLPLPEPPKEV